MKIDGKQLAVKIIEGLKQEVAASKLKPHMADFLVNGKPEDYTFVKTKEFNVKKIGGTFSFCDYKSIPEFEPFARKLRTISEDPSVTGVIIQQPLPKNLSTDTLYNYIPLKKEIEGHKNKSDFCPPIGLAILTILKYIFVPGDKEDLKDIKIDYKVDAPVLKRVLKKKKIVLLGRGETGGKPIAHILNQARINFINLHSKTPNPDYFLQEADIIITAVGKKVISRTDLKQGVILLNIGLRKENDVWKGDYDEHEVEDIASFYTGATGGVGPLDIAYLMDNLVTATKMLQKT